MSRVGHPFDACVRWSLQDLFYRKKFQSWMAYQCLDSSVAMEIWNYQLVFVTKFCGKNIRLLQNRTCIAIKESLRFSWARFHQLTQIQGDYLLQASQIQDSLSQKLVYCHYFFLQQQKKNLNLSFILIFMFITHLVRVLVKRSI